jgi:hypothetical protein
MKAPFSDVFSDQSLIIHVQCRPFGHQVLAVSSEKPLPYSQGGFVFPTLDLSCRGDAALASFRSNVGNEQLRRAAL